MLIYVLTVLIQLIGHSSGASITKNGITIKDANNIIIRNLKIQGVKGNDVITIQNSKRVWVDHNEFFSDPDIVASGPDRYVSHVQSTLLGIQSTLTSRVFGPRY